ncbi:hypothetical protein MTYP_00982 [Methylophilaceae bacterium]|nr:hypothetical protein MTYP_00982 [Methylophilaceae bacterium]
MLTNVIAAFLLPPLSMLLLFLLGLLVMRRSLRIARILLIISLVSLWLCSTPYVTTHAMQYLERQTSPLAEGDADAIVVLGSGHYFGAPEYGGQDTVSDAMLVRLRYAAELHRKTGKPVMVAGGMPEGNGVSEAGQAALVLEQEFGVPVRWQESASRNTYENAKHAYGMLQQAGVSRIYLVTHAWHMPRSSAAFRQAGFEVVEAPTRFTTRYRTSILSFLPNADAMTDARWFFHELVGRCWYRLRYGVA